MKSIRASAAVSRPAAVMMPAGYRRLLSKCKPAPIDTRWFDVVRLSGVAAVAGIRSGLPKVRAYSWQDDKRSLYTVFGLSAAPHCFDEPPHDWIDPLEPQITKAFVHFLTNCSPERQRARCLSFVKAAFACSPRNIAIDEAWRPLAVCAEAEENRIDILVELTDGTSRFGAVIEAKFAHRLTKGQLEKAEKHVLKRTGRAWKSSCSAFLVIAPLTDQIDPKLLAARPLWRAASWWTFLIRLDREIDGAQDCRDYRRFRRSVWHKSY